MWSSFENRLNMANGASNPCRVTSITTAQQSREPGMKFLANDRAAVFGQRVTNEATEPTRIYH